MKYMKVDGKGFNMETTAEMFLLEPSYSTSSPTPFAGTYSFHNLFKVLDTFSLT